MITMLVVILKFLESKNNLDKLENMQKQQDLK